MVEPTFDARAEHAGQAGLHVLIVGISKYLHLPRSGEPPTVHQQKYGLGLTQLTAAARTGYRLYEWLLASKPHLSLPLVTCRLLLAPSQEELNAVPELNDLVTDTGLNAFQQTAARWREDAAAHPQNMTLFYFAGHGFQRRRGFQVMLLADIGDGVGASLKNAVDTYSLMEGMAPSIDLPDLARRQLYFIDACRLPTIDGYRYEKQDCTDVWDVPRLDPDIPDDRVSTVFYTALPGTEAFAIPGEQTIFGKALMSCLEGGSAEQVNGRWCVTIDALNRGLRHYLARLQKEYNISQDFRLSGLGAPIVIRELKTAPKVEVDLEVSPRDRADGVQVSMNDLEQEQQFGPPLDPNPFRASLHAGKYIVHARFVGAPADDVSVERIESVNPPYVRLSFEL